MDGNFEKSYNDISLKDSINSETEEDCENQEKRTRNNIRKLSLSMPTKLDDMDELRIGNNKVNPLVEIRLIELAKKFKNR